MKKAVFYQIQDGDTGAQGLQGNFEALQQEIEAIPPYSLPIWLWMNFKAKVSEGTQICIKHNNKFCEFTNIP